MQRTPQNLQSQIENMTLHRLQQTAVNPLVRKNSKSNGQSSQPSMIHSNSNNINIEKQNRLINKTHRAMEKIFKSTLLNTQSSDSVDQLQQQQQQQQQLLASQTLPIRSSNKESQYLPQIVSAPLQKKSTLVNIANNSGVNTKQNENNNNSSNTQPKQLRFSENLTEYNSQEKTNKYTKSTNLTTSSNSKGNDFQSKDVFIPQQSLNSQVPSNNGKNIDKQVRIDGQIKKYMHKIGLEKKDRFPVFYKLDENGKEVKTTYQNTQLMNHLQRNNNTRTFQGTHDKIVDGKSRKSRVVDTDDGDNDESKKLTGSEELTEILKICGELHRDMSNFDRKNQKQARKTGNDYRKLTSQVKLIDMHNLLISQHDDPLLQPYIEQLQAEHNNNINKTNKKRDSLKNTLSS